MELGTAIALVYNLLNEHGLVSKGWTVKFSGASRRLGSCYYGKKLIRLSRHHVLAGSDDEVMNTIRHEVAHALAGRGAKHGPEWKAWAVKLGTSPRSMAHNLSYDIPSRYILNCGSCQRDIQKRRNGINPSRLNRMYCLKCGQDSRGMLSIRSAR